MPTSLPVSASASSVSARISASQRLVVQRVRQVERAGRRRQHGARTRARLAAPRRGSTSARASRTCGCRAPRRAAPTASRPCSARARAATRSSRRPGGVPGLVLRREVRVVVDVRVDQPQRDEPPVHAVVALRGDLPHPLAGHPRERADRVEVEVQVVGGRHGCHATEGIDSGGDIGTGVILFSSACVAVGKALPVQSGTRRWTARSRITRFTTARVVEDRQRTCQSNLAIYGECRAPVQWTSSAHRRGSHQRAVVVQSKTEREA